MASSDDSLQPSGEPRAAAPELRLLDRRAFVGFPPLTVSPGLTLTDFALQIPDVSFPFNVGGGPARYQRKKLAFGLLEVTLDAELLRRNVTALGGQLADLDELKLHFRPGYLEGQVRLRGGERTQVTFKVAFDGDGERLAVFLYDVRLYGFSATAACQVPLLLARSVRQLGLLPEVELLGATGFTARVLPPLCQLAAVGRGYKMPALDGARLSAVEVSSEGLKLRFAAGGLPPPTAPDEELLLTLEGARAFADPESLIAAGKLAEARDAYLRAADPSEAHPFAAERLLGLLVADPQAHELALDIAGSLLRRRERSPAALWAEAVVRERRGESARAAERYLALCALSRKNHEETGAFFAAEAAARAARDQAPQMAVKALHEVLGLRPDHLPSLKALARASDQARDRAGAIRAYRRMTALARDPADAAEAHVQLARLCALTEDDVAGARLHCEAALRLAPDHPEALYQLGELCFRAEEHLRALKALDRLKDVSLGRHELDRVGRAHLMAGRVWELGLGQLDNALLRYREAVSLLPGEPEPLYLAARVAEALGRLQEAVAGYVQAVELAGPSPRSEEVRAAAHASHRALARLYKGKLADPAKAREHLEAALGLDPRDMAALEELLPSFRAAGRAADLAAALEKAADLTDVPSRRAAYWAEAGELYRGRLSQPDKAERLLTLALDAEGHNRVALEGLLALAEARRDGPALCRALKALAELTVDPKERVGLYRRLVVAARDLAFDLELAALALGEVLRVEPEDLQALGDLCSLQRKRADMKGLALALEQRARVAEAQRDPRLAAAALRELGGVLEARLGRPGEALVALEKAARLAPEPGVLMELAEVALRCERPEHARRALEDVLAALPKHAAPERLAEVRARLGKACDLLGDKASAMSNYALALPLRRLDDELGLRLEALYEEAGRTRELAELWSTRAQALMGAERNEAAAPLLAKSARVLLETGNREGALQRFHLALELAPHGPQAPEVLEALAELELSAGNKLEAAKLLVRRAALLPEARPAARLYFRAAGLVAGLPREEGFLEEALRSDPTFAPARVRRGELLLAEQPSRALEDFEAALEAQEKSDGGVDALRASERLHVLRRAAEAAARVGQLESARAHLASYAAERPGDLDVLTELAALHRQAGAKEALWELLRELAPRLSGPASLAAYREGAELALQLGHVPEATSALRAVLERSPQDVWASTTLLGLLSAPGAAAEPSEVFRLLGVVVASQEGAARAASLERRSALHRASGRWAEAREDVLAAAELREEKGNLFRQAAELSELGHDAAGELDAWRRALAEDGALADVAAPRLLALARGTLQSQDFSSAQQSFAELVRLPLSPEARSEAYLGLADASLGLGSVPAALEALQQAGAQGPEPRRIAALLRRAELAEAHALSHLAIESLEAVLRISPRHEAARAALQRLLTEGEEWSALAELMASQAAQAPKDEAAPLYHALGQLYVEKLSLAGPAEAAFRKAAALAPSHAEARRELFRLLADRGEWAEAARMAEEAAQLLPPEAGAGLLREAGARVQDIAPPDVALRLLRKAHALVPAEGEDLFRLAEGLYVHGGREEALPLLERAARTADFHDAPERGESLLLAYADLLEQQGDPAAAEPVYRRLLTERPHAKTAAERLAALLGRKSPRAAIELLAQFALGRTPGEPVGRQLVELAERARAELADVELAARLLGQAAPMMREPLAVHQRLVTLLREAGRTEELMSALRTVASLCLQSEDLGAAISAYEEEAAVAENAGRVDDALRTLAEVRDVCLGAHQKVLAAEYERRRAELLRDAKLQLPAAQAALEQSYALYPEYRTAQLGASLAERQQDLALQVLWTEREVALAPDVQDRAQALLALARIQLQARHDVPAAEAALREALRLLPHSKDASSQLVALLEREGREADLAAHYEELAGRATAPTERVALFRKAAQLYRERAGRPDAAAAALLAARASAPADLALTAEAAELLHQAGRAEEAAEFDAQVLEQDPFRAGSFERHLAYLETRGDAQARAALMLARAQRQEGEASAQSYLEAARSFRELGAPERAALCERQAFEQSPRSDEAFAALRARHEHDPRKLSELLSARAHAVSKEAPALLRERAERLSAAGEALLAAEAWDDFLGVAPDDVQALQRRGDLAAEAGGPRAAQPYDRRLLQVSQDALPAAVRVRTELRLGHAALAAGAFQDAADALERVVSLDPEGERGQEALSLLPEVHARRGDTAGVYRASLKLAERAAPQEAEALYRRAADLLEDPREALDALLPLVRLRPSETALVERAARGLRALGRTTELLEVLDRAAAAVGGRRGAELWLEAAALARDELHDAAQARGLLERAAAVNPQNLPALTQLVALHRAAGAREPLRQTLLQLVAVSPPGDEASAWRLELAELFLASGDADSARLALQAVVERGPRGAGYAEALHALEPLVRGEKDAAAHANVQAARAELLEGAARAGLLQSAAMSSRTAGQTAPAIRWVRESLALEPSLEGFVLLAELWGAQGEHAKRAQALVQAAALAAPAEKPALLLEAATGWEQALEASEAQAVLERLAAEHPDALGAAELARRLSQLGAKDKAISYGFQPLMDQGAFAQALALADAAGDAGRAEQALWAQARAGGEGARTAVQRLAQAARASGPNATRRELAELAQSQGDAELARALFQAMLASTRAEGFSAEGVPEAALALTRLDALGEGDAATEDGVRGLSEEAPDAWTALLLQRVRALPAARAEAGLELLAERLPGRRAELLRELFERARDGRDFAKAAQLLTRLVQMTADGRARAALNLELGQLGLHALSDSKLARESFERVLTDDPQSAAAVRELVSLYRGSGDAASYVAMAERLGVLAGKEALAGEREPLAEAYEALGRMADAFRLLGELEPTRARMAQRARLAEGLGLVRPALELRERLAEDAAAKEQVARGYLAGGLIPDAARMARGLLEEGALEAESQRHFAERLSPTAQGASVAAALWPALLDAAPIDADGFTLYAEALRHLGRLEAAELVDGVGGALTASTAMVRAPALRPVTAGAFSRALAPPAGSVAITASTMQRLESTLRIVLHGLGAPELALRLDPAGGAVAYLVAPTELVLGAGALAHFGPVELAYLLALALALGDASQDFLGFDAPASLEAAALTALEAVPSALAAGRVLARLEPAVRGQDVGSEEAAAQLASSAAFRAVARAAVRMSQDSALDASSSR